MFGEPGAGQHGPIRRDIEPRVGGPDTSPGFCYGTSPAAARDEAHGAATWGPRVVPILEASAVDGPPGPAG